MNPSSGDILAGKYALLEPRGAGAMGQVWSARSVATGATVAVKILLPSRLASADGVARFRREAQATATLSHRAIVRVFDLVELSECGAGAMLMAMELLHGMTLAERLEKIGTLLVDEAYAVVLPLLSALEHAHALGIVHRDLKPENVLLAEDPDGHVMPKILDFGISKVMSDGGTLTDAGEIVGTVYYMSPEQARGGEVDGRTDLFSVGVLLYECLTGRHPFVSGDAVDVGTILRALFVCRPRPAQVIPPAIFQVLERALARDPRDRFPNAGEFADALRRAVPSASIPAAHEVRLSMPPCVKTVTRQAFEPPTRRWRVAVGATAALGLLALAAKGEPGGVSHGAALHVRHAAMTERVAHAKVYTPSVDLPYAASASACSLPDDPRERLSSRGHVLHDPGF
ncbi:MAG TPA: serine/threonine-protein kinase [Polyangiaceae bacterium]|jgi:serine/threonine-protein kinase